jgi:striatin 1/3/4
LVGFEQGGSQMLLSGGVDSIICVWKLPIPGCSLFDSYGLITHHRENEIRVHTDAVWSIDVLSDLETGVSAGADGTVKIWEITTGITRNIPIQDFPVCVKALTGKQFAVGCKSGNVRLFDDKFAQTAVISSGAAPVLKIQAIPTENQVVTLCDDNTFKVIDLNSREIVNELAGHENGASGLCVTPDGEFLITTGHDTAITFWQIGSFAMVTNFRLHAVKFGEGALCCAAASAKMGKLWFVTGGAEGTIHLFAKG